MQYVKNKDLTEELIKSIEQDQLTNKAVEMIMLITKRLMFRLKYQDSSIRDDCYQGALLNVLKYWRNFDPTNPKANAFSYITQIIKTGLCVEFKRVTEYGKLSNMTRIPIDIFDN